MQILDIPVSQITRHPHNPRRAPGDVTELAASMRESGLVQPIVVAPFGVVTTGKKKANGFVLIAGERRWTAAKTLKWQEIKAVVRDDLDTEARQIQAMLVENLQRADLTPIEEAEAYTQLAAFDVKPEEIAAATGRSVKTVKARMSLAKLSKPVAEKVHNGQISLSDAETLANFKGDAAAVAKLEKAIGTANFRWTVEDAKRKQKLAAAESRLKSKAAKSGGAFKVVKAPAYGVFDKGWRLIENLLADVPAASHAKYVDTAIAAHAKTGCDGMVAYCSTYEPFRVYTACTKPENHGRTVSKPGRPAETPAERKAREDRERRAEEDATASAARIGFVREVIGGKAFDLAPLLRMVVLNYCLYGEVGETALRVLGLEPPEKRHGGGEIVEQLVKGMKSPSAIASVLFALMAESAEPANHTSISETRGWLDTLQAYGYELSDVDKRLLPADDDEVDDDAEAEAENADSDEPERPVEDVVPAGEYADAV